LASRGARCVAGASAKETEPDWEVFACVN